MIGSTFWPRLSVTVLGLMVSLISASAAAQDLAKYNSVLQGVDEKTKKALDSIATQLPKSEAEGLLSRLPYGRTVHLNVPALKDFVSLKPGQDPKVVKVNELPSASIEAIIHSNPDFVPAYFLELGAQRQRSVARIRLKLAHDTETGTIPAGAGWGTGFLVSDSLLMTNNHVLEDVDFAKNKAVAQFNFQVGLDGGPLPLFEFDLDPDQGFYTNATLDFTIVRVKSKTLVTSNPASSAPVTPGTTWGHLTLSPSVHYAASQAVNIIQHPAGRYKEVVLRENEIAEISADVIRYTADTEPGSSGAPVFDNQWNLVAIHHAAGKQENGKWVSNEGIRIDRIVADISVNSKTIAKEVGLNVP